MRKKYIIPILLASVCMSACASNAATVDDQGTTENTVVSENAVEEGAVYSSNEGDSHAIQVDGTEETYQNITVEKSGDSEGDEADFYGTNAAVFATNGGTLTISDATIKTNGTHANGVFSYGEGTVVNISDSTIETEQSTSGGVMVTGGGTLNATNLTITTQSGSSAPIRSDRGGGQLNVNGGSYTSYGSGSPAVYSTADINVENATLYADVAEAIVVEGKNSVYITNSSVTGNNVKNNSDKADLYRNVMIYQSMSGDASEGKGEFSMTGGSLTAKNGAMFFVTNTVADINLENVEMSYASDDLLVIEKAGWGNDGSNGGQVTLNASNQSLEGTITVDEISKLNMYLKNASTFNGTINNSGEVYVEIEEGSTWTLTADTEISSLTCGENAINLNGYKLTVNGSLYEEGTKSEGEAIEIVLPTASEGGMQPPEKPEGMGDGNEPPAKPDGEMPSGASDGHQPPEKPEGMGDKE